MIERGEVLAAMRSGLMCGELRMGLLWVGERPLSSPGCFSGL
jgi:hypothetical protein